MSQNRVRLASHSLPVEWLGPLTSYSPPHRSPCAWHSRAIDQIIGDELAHCIAHCRIGKLGGEPALVHAVIYGTAREVFTMGRHKLENTTKDFKANAMGMVFSRSPEPCAVTCGRKYGATPTPP